MTSAYLIAALSTLSGLLIVTLTALKGWRDWLDLKRQELELLARHTSGGNGTSMARIELSDLKERIRKLEAIATGVDL